MLCYREPKVVALNEAAVKLVTCHCPVFVQEVYLILKI